MSILRYLWLKKAVKPNQSNIRKFNCGTIQIIMTIMVIIMVYEGDLILGIIKYLTIIKNG